VNILFHVTPSVDEHEIELDDQHSAYRFVDPTESDFHSYVSRVLDRHWPR
jgi:hypothetical protein